VAVSFPHGTEFGLTFGKDKVSLEARIETRTGHVPYFQGYISLSHLPNSIVLKVSRGRIAYFSEDESHCGNNFLAPLEK
jgi:hypothetical protein